MTTPDLPTLRAERDAARIKARHPLFAMFGTVAQEADDARLDALLLAERRLAVAEACEALKEESRNRHPYGDERHQRWLDVADFLRARLTPEETGR